MVEHVFDPSLRTLQDSPIDGPGGEYKIVVTEIVAGSKKTWREISISELQISGTLAPCATAKPNKPIVRVGSFDPPAPLTKADCRAVLFPAARPIPARPSRPCTA